MVPAVPSSEFSDDGGCKRVDVPVADVVSTCVQVLVEATVVVV